MAKFNQTDYNNWKEFRESSKSTIVQSEKELIANLILNITISLTECLALVTVRYGKK